MTDITEVLIHLFLPFLHLFTYDRPFRVKYTVNEIVAYRPDIKQTVTSGYCNVLYVIRSEMSIFRSNEGCPSPACSTRLRAEKS